MKFNIDNYKGKYVMHCKTKAELNDFIEYLKANKLPTPYHNGECYYGKNVYYFNQPYCWSSMDYAKQTNHTILEWEDFMKNTFTKADLRTGDVVLRRDGDVEIFNGELKMFIRRDGNWNDLDAINDDLSNTVGEKYDIIAVRRPNAKPHCSFDAFEYNLGRLVYEREEVEEMTLAEVCKLLGKNIKIVK